MVMEIYSDSDPRVNKYSGAISEYTALARSLQLPYWVWVAEEKPIGLLIAGEEPIRLFAPPGTPMAVIELVDPTQSGKNLERFAKEAKQAAAKLGVEYATIVISSEETNAINIFKRYDFTVLADSFLMVSLLDREYEDRMNLQFHQVRREEARKWAEQASQFLKGSPDTILELGLENLLNLPDSFVDIVVKSEEFYFVSRDGEAIGVLEISRERGTIGNIGVKPSERNKGYGKQIVIFGLRQLKASNCPQARLRVHTANTHAIRLYKSLGFTIKQKRKTLIWRRAHNIKDTCTPL
jgi:ribosomal protein S18 acetylase RimI-like enzyme